ncbi:hypothetical protein D3C72_1829990 [compost metagenome]
MSQTFQRALAEEHYIVLFRSLASEDTLPCSIEEHVARARQDGQLQLARKPRGRQICPSALLEAEVEVRLPHVLAKRVSQADSWWHPGTSA